MVGTAKGLRSTLQSGRLPIPTSPTATPEIEIAHRISTHVPPVFLGQLMDRKDTRSRCWRPFRSTFGCFVQLLNHQLRCDLHCDAQALGTARQTSLTGQVQDVVLHSSERLTRRIGIKSISKDQLYLYIHILIFMCLSICICHVNNLSRPWQVHFMKRFLPSGKSRKPPKNRTRK